MLTAEEIVNEVVSDYELDYSNVEEFLSKCFSRLVDQYQKESSDYQSLGSRAGDVFEVAFVEAVRQLFSVPVERGVEIPEAHMTGAGAADSVFYRSEKKDEIVGVAELKGDPEEYGKTDGTVLHSSANSGLNRSDTTKKAVAQAFKFKNMYDNYTAFFVVSNTMPSEGSSAESDLKVAEGKIIDEIVDITSYPEMEEMMVQIYGSDLGE